MLNQSLLISTFVLLQDLGNREKKYRVEISVYSPHIPYMIFTYYLVRFRKSNFMYKMCTRRVVGVCVSWSAYIKEKNYTYFVCTLHISYVFVYLRTKGPNRIWTHNFHIAYSHCIVLITITLC